MASFGELKIRASDWRVRCAVFSFSTAVTRRANSRCNLHVVKWLMTDLPDFNLLFDLRKLLREVACVVVPGNENAIKVRKI